MDNSEIQPDIAIEFDMEKLTRDLYVATIARRELEEFGLDPNFTLLIVGHYRPDYILAMMTYAKRNTGGKPGKAAYAAKGFSENWTLPAWAYEQEEANKQDERPAPTTVFFRPEFMDDLATDLSQGAKSLLLEIVSHGGWNRTCDVPQVELRGQLEESEFRGYLKELIDCGYVNCERRPGYTNLYLITDKAHEFMYVGGEE